MIPPCCIASSSRGLLRLQWWLGAPASATRALASWSRRPGGFARPACQRVRWRCRTHRVRTTLSTLVAKDISRRRGAGVATGPVKFVVGALRRLDWTWGQVGGRLDRLHIRVHLWWVSSWARRLLVVTGARCPLTKPVVTAVELQTPDDH
jgi:hypothetical protein